MKTVVILAEITREISNGHRHINIYQTLIFAFSYLKQKLFFTQYFQEKKDEEKKPAEEAKKAKEPKAKKPVSHVQDFEEDMVYLFQFTRSPQVRLYN